MDRAPHHPGTPAARARSRKVPGPRRALLLAALCLVAILGAAPVAGAHTEFESSDPADGAVTTEPVATVTVVFTAAAEPAGEGFQVLDPAGELRTPSSVSAADGRTWVLTFDEPLAGGAVGVRWSVRAGDSHPISGSFSFTAGGAAPAAPTNDITTAVGPDPSAEVDGRDEVSEAQPEDELEAFLVADDEASAASAVVTFGRIVRLLGVVLGLGALVFVSYVLVGGRNEIGRALSWIRRFALLAVSGSLSVGVASAVRGGGSGWSGLWSSSVYSEVLRSDLGVSLILGLTGGAAMWIGANGASDGSVSTASEAHRWRAPAVAVLGAVLLLASFLFTGHTVTRGSRILTGLTDVIHVGTAAVWAGGVTMLASVLRHRRRRSDSGGPALLAARFSVVATYSVAAAALAGVVLTVTVLDAPSQLWSTDWGRLLCLKVALVGCAVAAGGYNHFALVPTLETDPDDPSAIGRLKKVVTAESLLVVAIIVVTGFLVGASV